MAGVSSPPLKLLRINNFAGGLNLRDAQSELAPNESPDLWNVTLDERGGISKRLGCDKYNGSAFQAALVFNTHYSKTVQKQVTQCGAKLYLETSTVAVHTFTTTARVGFADFAGKLCVIHPIDGLYTSTDGSTYTVVADADCPKGDVLFPWQNKLFSAGNPTNVARVSWSAAGDPTSWGATDFNDLREKDSEKIVALAGAAGIDIAGRQGLLAFKRQSTYRIYDSATGAYQTIDAKIGAASALSVVSVSGRTVALSQEGVFWTDGVSALKPASERLDPLFRPDQIAFDKLDNFCAGVKGERVYLSLTRFGGTVNNLALEYHPTQDWIVSGSNAASCYATYGKNTEKLYAGSPTVNGQVYELLVGGDDDGTAISSWFQTRWFEPGDGILCRFRRLRVTGRGSGTLYLRVDYSTTNGDAQNIEIVDDTIHYDDSHFYDDDEMYGPSHSQDYQDFYSLGTAKAISLRIEEESSDVGVALQILGSGNSPEVGAWSIYDLSLLHIPLGLA